MQWQIKQALKFSLVAHGDYAASYCNLPKLFELKPDKKVTKWLPFLDPANNRPLRSFFHDFSRMTHKCTYLPPLCHWQSLIMHLLKVLCRYAVVEIENVDPTDSETQRKVDYSLDFWKRISFEKKHLVSRVYKRLIHAFNQTTLT